MSARQHRNSYDRLAAEGYAAHRAKAWRRAKRTDVAEGLSDYRRNGVTR